MELSTERAGEEVTFEPEPVERDQRRVPEEEYEYTIPLLFPTYTEPSGPRQADEANRLDALELQRTVPEVPFTA